MSKAAADFTPGLELSLRTIPAKDFDLERTLSCGQVFHWEKAGAGWNGAIGETSFYVEQVGETLLVPAGGEAVARHYFALDHPLREIYATFPRDPAMDEALEFCRGMRIIRQPPWECVATFITSSMKQVAHIAQISHTLRRRFGTRLELGGRACFSYPTPEALGCLDETDLRACSLGYRAKNLLRSAQMISTGEVNLSEVAELDDAQALAALCRLAGVGEKVANCALLFGFGRLRAFPIDVWIQRVLQEIYFRGKKEVTPRQLREFSHGYFGPYGGYAQQYLFHHARKTWPRRAAKSRAPARKRPKRES